MAASTNLILTGLLLLSLKVLLIRGQCPWSRELIDLHADCICAYNNVQRLSIQCSPVNFTRLMYALHASVEQIPIDLLYVNNSTIEVLPDNVFKNMEIQSLHVSRSKLKNISSGAFDGLERSLNSLSLQDNLLPEVPTEAIHKLSNVKELDLSHNHITDIPEGAFKGLPLSTLKIADNELNISDFAFRGLESTLKNLNLKGAGLTEFPKALSHLEVLAFLDLAQNKISNLEPGSLSKMERLTAVNLERNRIAKIDGDTFSGVDDSLSSLSLLNNLLSDFPTEALATLVELRVLDLGFNEIRVIPDNGFQHNHLLTLLALDGNPLSTVPNATFRHLNSTLRGLSIGGSFLVCDCNIRWIAEWVRKYDLQVTSRERNPQFCGQPDHLRRRSFFQLTPIDFVCENEINTAATFLPSTTLLNNSQSDVSNPKDPLVSTLTNDRTTKGPKRLDSGFEFRHSQTSPSSRKAFSAVEEVSLPSVSVSVSSKPQNFPSNNNSLLLPPNGATRPSIQSRSDDSDYRLSRPTIEEIKILDAYRDDSSIVIDWRTQTTNLLGFQVLYRIFGESEFKRSPELVRNQRRFVLHSIPRHECVVVCVVNLESGPVLSIDSVPYSQCKEIAGEHHKSIELDKIVIGASAAICGVIIIAVIIFVCCYRRNRKKEKRSVPMVPTATPATLPAIKSEHEWETSSMYSSRSIPRARMYHMEPNGNGSVNHSFVMDDNRSHISHYSQMPNGYPNTRSTADGQSHRSYSQFSNRFSNGNALGNPEMRKSQMSLSQLSGHHSFLGSQVSMPKKSRSHGRLNSAHSMHSLNEYTSDWNTRPGWKDQEVDIYVGQNHVVPTHAKYRKDYGAR